jgi:hypothetical protein
MRREEKEEEEQEQEEEQDDGETKKRKCVEEEDEGDYSGWGPDEWNDREQDYYTALEFEIREMIRDGMALPVDHFMYPETEMAQKEEPEEMVETEPDTIQQRNEKHGKGINENSTGREKVTRERAEEGCRKPHKGYQEWMTPPELIEEWIGQYQVNQESHWNEAKRNNILPGLPHGESYEGKRLIVNPPWTYGAMEEAFRRIQEENPKVAVLLYPTRIRHKQWIKLKRRMERVAAIT